MRHKARRERERASERARHLRHVPLSTAIATTALHVYDSETRRKCYRTRTRTRTAQDIEQQERMKKK